MLRVQTLFTAMSVHHIINIATADSVIGISYKQHHEEYNGP